MQFIYYPIDLHGVCGLESLPPSNLGPIDAAAFQLRTYGDELDDPFRRTPRTQLYGRYRGLRPRPSVMKREGTLVGDHPRCHKGMRTRLPR